MSIIHAFRRSYNPGSKPVGRDKLMELVQRDLKPNQQFFPKDVLRYAYTMKQYRRLAENIGKPAFDYGEIIKRGPSQPDSDPDCDDFGDDSRAKMNEERILVGSDRPVILGIDYESISRGGFHDANVVLAASEHDDSFSWWIFQWDTQKWEEGKAEIGYVRELW